MDDKINKTNSNKIVGQSQATEKATEKNFNEALLRMANDKLGFEYNDPAEVFDPDNLDETGSPRKMDFAPAFRKILDDIAARRKDLLKTDPTKERIKYKKNLQYIRASIARGEKMIEQLSKTSPQFTQEDLEQLRTMLYRVSPMEVK